MSHLSESAHQASVGGATVVIRLRGHGRVLVLPFLAATAVAGVATLWLPGLPAPFPAVGAAAAVVLGLIVSVRPYLRWLSTVTTITETDVVVTSGILRRRHHRIGFDRIVDIAVHQNIGQSMAGSGDIELNSGMDRPFVIRDVATVAKVRASLVELMRAHSGHPTR